PIVGVGWKEFLRGPAGRLSKYTHRAQRYVIAVEIVSDFIHQSRANQVSHLHNGAPRRILEIRSQRRIGLVAPERFRRLVIGTIMNVMPHDGELAGEIVIDAKYRFRHIYGHAARS